MKLNKKNKIKYTKLAHIQLIKILMHHPEYKKKIINNNITYEKIIELIKKYYAINNLKEPNITIQSISNIKNRKLR